RPCRSKSRLRRMTSCGSFKYLDAPSAEVSEAGQSPTSRQLSEVADGTRTHDHLDHNQGLYQLSYSHRARNQDSRGPIAANAGFAGVRHNGSPIEGEAAGSHHGAAKPRRTSRGDAPGRIRTSDPRLRRPP